ncbi:MAG: hypothetical protein MUF27_00085 [Acidobacteria bacterium]|jgi:hypothetical protein|nr:hypothetical protein [Acidobacteriota bacterium]
MRSTRHKLTVALALLLAFLATGSSALAQSTKPFKIKATAGKGGSVSPRSASVQPGADQTFQVTASSGFYISSVAVDGSNQPVPPQATSYSYTFTNVQAKHSLKASFAAFTYPVTVEARDGISVSPMSGSYTAGKKVKFTIRPPASGGTILATLDGRTISLSRAGKNFSYTLTVSGPHTLVFALDLPNQSLTVSRTGSGSGVVTSNPAGINCGESCTASYDAGTVVTLTATPIQGSVFAGWSGACTGTGTCSVTMSAARSVTATFNAIPVNRTLTVSVTPEQGGFVISEPRGIGCGSGYTLCQSDFPSGTVIVLNPDPTTGFSFAGWTGACSGTGLCVVTLNADSTVGANFSGVAQPTLSVSVTPDAGGSVASAPAGISCGAGNTQCSNAWPVGTGISLTATPVSGWNFTGWSGACTGTGSCAITLNANASVGANFAQVTPKRTLSVNVSAGANAAGGRVDSTPAGINCGQGNSACSAQYDDGTQVGLAAHPASGWKFTGWSGACSGTGACSVTLNGDASVGAAFVQDDGGGGNPTLGVKVVDNCGVPVSGALVAVHDRSDGTVEKTFTTGPSGVVDLSSETKPLTFSAGRPNTTVSGDLIFSFVDIPDGVGTLVVSLPGGVEGCGVTDPEVGTVTVSLNPTPTLFGRVQPFEFGPTSWIGQTSKQYTVKQSHLQNNGTISLMGDNSSFSDTGPPSYGFLLDQPFTNGASYTIDLNRTAAARLFNAVDPVDVITVTGVRGEQAFSVGTKNYFPAASNGQYNLFDQFPLDYWITLANQSFFPVNGAPTAFSTYTETSNTAPPATLQVPRLMRIDPFSYSSGLMTWGLDDPPPAKNNKVGRVWFVYTDPAQSGKDRTWQVVLNPKARTSWNVTNLTLPPELAPTGLNLDRLVSLYVTDYSPSSSYAETLSLFFAGQGSSPSLPFTVVTTLRSPPLN